jgi:hypothetical protein
MRDLATEVLPVSAAPRVTLTAGGLSDDVQVSGTAIDNEDNPVVPAETINRAARLTAPLQPRARICA